MIRTEIAAACLALCLPLTALAAEAPAPKTPLAICNPDDPSRSSPTHAGLIWAAQCLMTAVRAEDRNAIAALVPQDKDLKVCPNGKFCYEVIENFAFEKGGDAEGPTSLWMMLSRQQNVDLEVQGGYVFFIINKARWKAGTAKERRDYFTCAFDYDRERKMWTHLYSGLCGAEGDAWMLDWHDGKDHGPQP